MARSILIIGGYGAVGTVVASTLAQQHADQLIIAGRSEARAAALAAKLGQRIRWRALDVAQPLDYDSVFEDVSCVVMCLDVPNTDFVREVLQRSIAYVDISAEYELLAAISGFDSAAKQHGATAVLSAGLVPGLSNLMARHSLQFVKPIDHFDSALLAGLGEKHGAGGSTWILNHLGDSRGTTRFQFGAPFHEQVVHRYAFSDQHTLTQTLPIASAATWLGFDSLLMTQLIALARLPLLRRLFQQRMVKQLLLNATQRWQFGTEDFVLTTRARGAAGSHQAWLRGKREALVTGLVTAETVRRIVTQKFPAGVYHVEQLFQLEDFLPLLKQHGVTFCSRNG